MDLDTTNQLVDLLTEAYGDKGAIEALLHRSGLRPSSVDLDGSVKNVWPKVWEATGKAGLADAMRREVLADADIATYHDRIAALWPGPPPPPVVRPDANRTPRPRLPLPPRPLPLPPRPLPLPPRPLPPLGAAALATFVAATAVAAMLLVLPGGSLSPVGASIACIVTLFLCASAGTLARRPLQPRVAAAGIGALAIGAAVSLAGYSATRSAHVALDPAGTEIVVGGPADLTEPARAFAERSGTSPDRARELLKNFAWNPAQVWRPAALEGVIVRLHVWYIAATAAWTALLFAGARALLARIGWARVGALRQTIGAGLLAWGGASGAWGADLVPQAAGRFSQIAFHPSAPLLLSVDGNVALIWSFEDGRGSIVRRLAGHTGEITGSGWGAGGRKVLTAGRDRRAVWWDVRSGERTVVSAWDFPKHPREPFSLESWASQRRNEAKEREYVAAAASGSGSWALLRRNGTLGVGERDRWMRSRHRDGGSAVALSDDGSVLVTAYEDWAVVQHLVRDGDRIWFGRRFGHSVPGLAEIGLSGDGSRLLTLTTRGDLGVRDVGGEGAVKDLLATEETVVAAGLSADGRRVAMITDDNALIVRDLDAGSALLERPLPDGPRSVAASADGSLVAVAFAGEVRVWDVQTGRVRARLQRGAQIPVDAALIDKKILVAGLGIPTRWDLGTGERLDPLQLDEGEEIYALARQGAALVTAGSRGIARWGTAGERDGFLDLPEAWDVAASEDRIVAVDAGGTAHLASGAPLRIEASWETGLERPQVVVAPGGRYAHIHSGAGGAVWEIGPDGAVRHLKPASAAWGSESVRRPPPPDQRGSFVGSAANEPQTDQAAGGVRSRRGGRPRRATGPGGVDRGRTVPHRPVPPPGACEARGGSVHAAPARGDRVRKRRHRDLRSGRRGGRRVARGPHGAHPRLVRRSGGRVGLRERGRHLQAVAPRPAPPPNRSPSPCP